MTTAERALALGTALEGFPNAIARGSGEMLLDLVRAELGHPEILDGFQSRESIRSMAIAPRCILHVLAGNTPNAAIQSVAIGLLLGSANRVKLPSKAPEVGEALKRFLGQLPNQLRETVEVKVELPDVWLTDSGAVIVFGSDDTVSQLRGRIRPWQKFIAHGHRLSFGIVFKEASAGGEAARRAASDVSLFDQLGCLSPHDVYVEESVPGEARTFAKRLAGEMRQFNESTPRGDISPSETQEIFHLRSGYSFRAVSDHRVAVWASRGSTEWTVIYEEDPQFAVSCLNRLVFVKPLPAPDSMAEHLRLVRPHLSTIAIWPFSATRAEGLTRLGASRICPLGESQSPTAFWHPDGISTLQQLVDWIDLG
jgi:hypothetical protein